MFSGIIEDIGFGIFKAIFSVFVAFPLILIRAITRLYAIIASELPIYLLFGVKPGQNISEGSVPEMFSRLAIISVIIFIIFFTVAAVRVGFYKTGEQKNPLVVALKYSVIGFLWVIFLPIASYGFLMLVNAILDLLLGNNDFTLDQIIFNALYTKKDMPNITFNEWVAISNDNYNFPRGVWNKFAIGQGWLVIFTGLIMSVATIIPLFLGILTLVQKVFQQFILFIISPFIAAASVADDGKRMKLWQNMFFTKSVVILTFVVSIQLLGVFLNRSVGFANTFDDFGMRFLLILGLCAGGAVASMSMSSMTASFVGESASVRETMSETKGMIAGGMSMFGAAKMAGGLAKKLGIGSFKAAKGLGQNISKGISGINDALTAGVGAGFGSRMSALSNLRDSFKKGEITKEQYKLERSQLHNSFEEHQKDIYDSNEQYKQQAKAFKKEYGVNVVGKSMSQMQNMEFKMDSDLEKAQTTMNNYKQEYGESSQQYLDAKKDFEQKQKKRVDFADLYSSKAKAKYNKDFFNANEKYENLQSARSDSISDDVINNVADNKKFEDVQQKEAYIKKNTSVKDAIKDAKEKYENLEFRNKWKRGGIKN